MKLDKSVFKLAIDKKYYDFSNSIKSVLSAKMGNHAIMKSYTANVNQINSLKDNFLKINNTSEE